MCADWRGDLNLIKGNEPPTPIDYFGAQIPDDPDAGIARQKYAEQLSRFSELESRASNRYRLVSIELGQEAADVRAAWRLLFEIANLPVPSELRD
jgi:hypothetical protein